jgi:hypothetical protein
MLHVYLLVLVTNYHSPAQHILLGSAPGELVFTGKHYRTLNNKEHYFSTTNKIQQDAQ